MTPVEALRLRLEVVLLLLLLSLLLLLLTGLLLLLLLPPPPNNTVEGEGGEGVRAAIDSIPKIRIDNAFLNPVISNPNRLADWMSNNPSRSISSSSEAAEGVAAAAAAAELRFTGV